MSVTSLGLVHATFNGINGGGPSGPQGGPVSVPGLKVGDVVLCIVASIGTGGPLNSSFEPIISVDDEIQQTTPSDFSALAITSVLCRKA